MDDMLPLPLGAGVLGRRGTDLDHQLDHGVHAVTGVISAPLSGRPAAETTPTGSRWHRPAGKWAIEVGISWLNRLNFPAPGARPGCSSRRVRRMRAGWTAHPAGAWPPSSW